MTTRFRKTGDGVNTPVDATKVQTQGQGSTPVRSRRNVGRTEKKRIDPHSSDQMVRDAQPTSQVDTEGLQNQVWIGLRMVGERAYGADDGSGAAVLSKIYPELKAEILPVSPHILDHGARQMSQIPGIKDRQQARELTENLAAVLCLSLN
jgi:hypothetical protein